MIQASSAGPGGRGGARCRRPRRRRSQLSARPRARRDHVGLAEHQPGALVGVVDVDRHVGRAGGQDGQDRDVQLGGAGGDADADAVPRADPLGVKLGGPGDHLGSQLAVGEHDRAVVDRRCRAMGVDARAEDVDERARRPRLAGAAEPVTEGLRGRGPVHLSTTSPCLTVTSRRGAGHGTSSLSCTPASGRNVSTPAGRHRFGAHTVTAPGEQSAPPAWTSGDRPANVALPTLRSAACRLPW